MTKLHLGCSRHHIDGYINIDIQKSDATDLISDIRYLSSIEENSIDLIYASNVLEHFKPHDINIALNRWYKLLIPGGILRLSVPDLTGVFEYYMETGDLEECYSSIYGGHKTEYSTHYWGWDFQTLKKTLEGYKFKNVHRYDRAKTEHAHIRDWSENYLPHIKNGVTVYYPEWIKGTNIALNVEATK